MQPRPRLISYGVVPSRTISYDLVQVVAEVSRRYRASAAVVGIELLSH